MPLNLDELFLKAAKPQEAHGDWNRFLENYFQETGRVFKEPQRQKGMDGFLKIFGNSRFLSRFIIQNPIVILEILKSPFLFKAKGRTSFQIELSHFDPCQKKDDPFALLRQFKYRELLRISMKDFMLDNQEIILNELSDLAGVLLERADHLIDTQLNHKKRGADGHALVALGKLGGHELNYSSDIDLLAVTQNDEGQFSNLSAHEFYVRHFQALSTELQKMTKDGFLYRTDWDLRPEGKAGTLVNSIKSLESYYEAFGKDWERQALIKASFACGSQKLANQFLKRITPFVYRRSLNIQNIYQIQRMNQRIRDELENKEEGKFNVKLGRGGIREIEFFVQAFQLIYGGININLRHTNTIEALKKLIEFKLIPRDEGNLLSKAYLFLRKLEHRLQLVEETQTHALSFEPVEQIRVARRMGYDQEDPENALSHFQQDFYNTTRSVHEIFKNLFLQTTSFIVPKTSFAPTSLPEPDSYFLTCQKWVESEKNLEQKNNVICLFKNKELNKIIKSDQGGEWSRRKILLKLSELAESVCLVALKLAREILEPIYGKPVYEEIPGFDEPSHLMTLGMGKFGGREINYSSDLDLIFIYSENGGTTGPNKISNSWYFAKLVQKFISILSVITPFGDGYEIDTELRPSGNTGPLLTSLDHFLEYQRRVSQIWERQSLLKARPLASPSPLSKLVSRHLEALLYSESHPSLIRQEMNRLRLRVEKEIAKENNHLFDYKRGKGGVMDIEFILQYFQLRLGSEYPSLRTLNTFEGLDFLLALNLLPSQEKAKTLIEAHEFYRTFESKIFLHSQKKWQRISVKDDVLEKVAKDFGLDRGKDLVEKYLDMRERVREIYLRVFKK